MSIGSGGAGGRSVGDANQVSALILAGGKATRFGGIAKHELVVDGETILARQTRVLAPCVAEILVSSPQPIEGYRTVADMPEHSGAGPLAGIAAGLSACRTTWLLVLAGDMPYITGDLVRRLLAVVPADPPTASAAPADHVASAAADPMVSGARGLDAVGVRVNALPEPLVCVLHRRTLPVVERRIAARRFKASGLLTDEGLRVTWIDWADAAALQNINSPEDLAREPRE